MVETSGPDNPRASPNENMLFEEGALLVDVPLPLALRPVESLSSLSKKPNDRSPTRSKGASTV